MVLDNVKIPKNIDGFYLSNWDKYNPPCIISEKLKNTLEKIEKATEILIFDKIEISNE